MPGSKAKTFCFGYKRKGYYYKKFTNITVVKSGTQLLVAGVMGNSEETGLKSATSHISNKNTGRYLPSSWVILDNHITVNIFRIKKLLIYIKTTRK